MRQELGSLRRGSGTVRACCASYPASSRFEYRQRLTMKNSGLDRRWWARGLARRSGYRLLHGNRRRLDGSGCGRCCRAAWLSRGGFTRNGRGFDSRRNGFVGGWKTRWGGLPQCCDLLQEPVTLSLRLVHNILCDGGNQRGFLRLFFHGSHRFQCPDELGFSSRRSYLGLAYLSLGSAEFRRQHRHLFAQRI